MQRALLGALAISAALLSCGASGRHTVGPSSAPDPALGVPSRLVIAACRHVAQAPVRRVYCPPVVPTGHTKVSVDAVVRSRTNARRWTYLLDFQSPSISTLAHRKLVANGGHWNVAATTDAWLEGQLYLADTRVQQSKRRLDLDGVVTTRYLIPADLESYFSGHVVLRWGWRGVRYFVSMHAFGNEDRAQAMAHALIALQTRCAAVTAAPRCRLVFVTRQGRVQR
jgi:hypothetical protein